MSYGVKLRVWGEYACFTRPEMKAERVSYDVMTPSAARGILEAIHWKPAIRWVVDQILVLKPIRFETLRRNELADKILERNIRTSINNETLDNLHTVVEDHRQQRSTTLLRDVEYVIEAHFNLTKEARKDDTEAKHLCMFKRRAAKGKCFHRPYLGTREFVANFMLIEGKLPKPNIAVTDRDLGLMLLDMNYENKKITPLFFPAKLCGGVLNVPRPNLIEIKT